MENDLLNDDSLKCGVRLKKGINLDDLVSGKPTIFEVNFDDIAEKDEEESFYRPEDISTYLDELKIEDEDVFQPGQSFDAVEQKSVNLTEDGKVKKRVLREGYGSPLPDLCEVTIHYNAYLEYQDEPFDSSYIRRRPCNFRLNNGAVIVGLNTAVKSMKINEKSQFLIDPDYAYGKQGCLERIPPNSTILYEVELIKFVDSGATISYEHLKEEKQKTFEEVYKLAHALCAKGNDLFSKGSYKIAIKEYNIAVSKLEFCNLSNYDDQIKQQELLLRLHSNLVVAYTKIKEPRKACKNANLIYAMCKNSSLKVPVKVYFNNARSLIMLSEYDVALWRLKDAQKLEPQNSEIAKEFKKLESLKQDYKKREIALAKAIFTNTENKQKSSDVTNVCNEFKKLFREFCEHLQNNVGVLQYNLPTGLTQEEVNYAKLEATKFGFEVKCIDKNNSKNYYLIKKSEIPNAL